MAGLRFLAGNQGNARSDSNSGQEEDHGDYEKGDPHPMQGIPLSEFPLSAFRESIRVHPDHAVVDWHEGQQRKRDRGAPENDGDSE
jgi:hypothetical protein